MIINHNINALAAISKFNAAGKVKSDAMEKLSSGMRINKAADDAAGSAIDEKMRSQIMGLQQAGSNIQEGISLLQTADSGLASIQNPNLMRMRDLIVQSLNGTLNNDDRVKIQNEIDSLKDSINGVANSTEFNSIKLLTVPASEIAVPPKVSTGKADIVFIIDRTGSMGSKIDEVKNNLDSFINKLSDNGIDVNMGLVTYGDVNESQGGDATLKSSMTNDLGTFKSYLNGIEVGGGGDANESGLEGIADSTNGALSYSLRDDAVKQFILVTDASVHDGNSDTGGGDGESTYTIDSVAAELKDKGITFTAVSGTDSTVKNQLERLSQPTGGEYLDMDSGFADQLSSFASKILVGAGLAEGTTGEEMPTLNLQIGANYDDNLKVQLFDATTKKLGIDDVKVDTNDDGRKSLDMVDKAMDLISAQRGKFGAYQNRLEHIYDNVGSYSSSLTNADSRITDVDMAKETMDLAKGSILQESAQSVIKQCKNMQESVSNLITKWQGNNQ